MKIIQAEFIKSFGSFTEFNCPNHFNIAFIGRSNVGKSTIINLFCQRKNLVKTSQTPGKTQLINLFKLQFNSFGLKKEIFLTDLPGYGYAKLNKDQLKKLQEIIIGFLKNNLANYYFLLIDIRRGLMDIDSEYLQYLAKNNVSNNLSIILTKADKLKPKEIEIYKKNIQQKFKDTLTINPPLFINGWNINEDLNNIKLLIDNMSNNKSPN